MSESLAESGESTLVAMLGRQHGLLMLGMTKGHYESLSLQSVWIINEGSPGHLAQSRGLAQAMQAQNSELEVVELDVQRRFSGVQRSIIRWLMGAKGRRVPAFLEKQILFGMQLPDGRLAQPDLILSSGGKSAFCARVLANRHSVPYVYIGERKPYRSEWFHTVFTPSPVESDCNDVLIDMIPTGVTPEKVAQAAADYKRPEGDLWAMIVGGSSRSHPYAKSDWLALAAGLNTLANKHGIRWLLTTSRRTGTEVEQLLKETIQPAYLADVIWWADKPEKRMLALLGSSERVFVTQDSVTMVTECVASGRAVFVLRPKLEVFPKGSFMPLYLERLQTKGLIDRMGMSSLSGLEILDVSSVKTVARVEDQMALALGERLLWK